MLLCGIGLIFVVRNCEAETLPQGAGRFSIEEQAGVLMAGAPAKQIAEKNAARYLWLRAQHWNDSAFAVVSEPKRNVKLGTYCPSEDRLDQEIDSAMGADHEI